jgi:hypothetical protein
MVGALENVEGPDLPGYKALLWFNRGASPLPDRLGLDARKVTVEPVIPFDADRTAAALDRLIVRDSLHLPSIFVSDDAVSDQDASYLPVIEGIIGQVQSHQRARATRQADGYLWQSNLLANLPVYLRRRMPSAWAGACDGLPAFICGAGPSLDASIGKLAEIAPSGVVLAADSALRALDKRGIGVDFVLSVDARKLPSKCLPPTGPVPARLVLASKSPPAWQQAVEESRLYFLSGSQLTEDWLASSGVSKTAIAVHENCGITGLELALHLGCRPICLFGMDHAVDAKEPTRWHHQDLSASQHGAALEPGRNLAMVPGNYQAEIGTRIYWEWRKLNSRCAALPTGLLFNVTDRGARLSNTTVVLPECFSIDARPDAKAAKLAALALPEAPNAATTQQLFKLIRTTATRAEPILDRASRLLQGGVSDRAVSLLASAFRDQAFCQLIGNYCLKIMPHLKQPHAGDAAFWSELVAECQGLIALAKTLR